MKKILSIVIPAYNASKTIYSTLESVERNFQKYDVEIVVVDDGSTDETYKKIISYKDRTQLQLKVIKQKNKGEGGARNTGLLNCNSDYVLFLDADDVFLDFDFGEIKRILETKEYSCVVGGYEKSTGNAQKKYTFEEEIISNNDLILKQVFSRILLPGIGNTFFKKDIIDNNDIEFKAFKYGADNDFVRTFSLFCSKVKVIEDVIFSYVYNTESVMNQSFSLDRIDSIRSVERTMRLCNEVKIDKPSSLYVSLISEIRGCCQSFVISDKDNNNDTLKKLLKHMPNQVRFRDFVSSKRTFWLLANYFFYCFPKLYLDVFKFTHKDK
ncbi:glycosyltransferase family 2 protein [Vibrio sp. 10N.286.46.E10]|nr:glycosyltransferase family 2 protein [Vibrio sp. 10N.286.46.E10]